MHLPFLAMAVAVASISIPAKPQAAQITVVSDASHGLRQPFAIAFERNGSMVVCEMEPSHRVVRVARDGHVTLIAGGNGEGDRGDYGPARDAQLKAPHDLKIDRDGTLVIADTFARRVRRIPPGADQIEPWIGTGAAGFSGDGGIAWSAQLAGAYSVAMDEAGGWAYIADLENRRVRRVNLKSNLIETFAGNGLKGKPSEGGIARNSSLVDPRSVAVDSQHRVYILERGGHALRVVDPDGRIHTVAGTGKPGFSGDGGPALAAAMNGPKYLCIDRDDSVLIVDTENHAVRKYNPRTKTMHLIAGGKRGNRVGRSPTELELDRPHGVTVGPDNALYIADSDNNRIVRIAR